MATQPTLPTEEDVLEALRSVDDPEVGINIVDLGLVCCVDLNAGGVRVELTMTSPACPLGDLISEQAQRAVAAVLPVGVPVDVEVVWDPIWTPDRMSETAKQTLGWPQ